MKTTKRFWRSLVLVAAGAILLLIWFAPSPLPEPPALPKPNGYQDFLNASKPIRADGKSDAPTDSDGSPGADKKALESLLERLREPISLLRTGLARQSRVPVEFSTTYMDRHEPELSSFK